MLSIGVISFVFFFPPVYMREPKKRDKLFEILLVFYSGGISIQWHS